MKKCLFFLMASFCLAVFTEFAGFTGNAAAYERFAVDVFNGVPMLTLDGTPVRARIFWGRVGSRGLNLTDEFQKVEFEFVPAADAKGRGTMHFRFGKTPGVIFIDDYEIVEKETGRMVAGPYHFEEEEDFTKNWHTWNETVKDRTIATLHVEPGCGTEGSGGLKITILPGNETFAADFHVYHNWCMDLKPDRTYIVRFAIRTEEGARKAHIAFYRPDATHVSLWGLGEVLRSQTQLAADVGVDFVSFMLCDNFWIQPDGSYDFTLLDAYCDRILAANPRALIIPRIELNATQWWLDANPDEKMRWEHIQPQDLGENWNWASPASEKYRAAACDALRAAIRHLDAKYGNSIAGYHPAGQNTQEWFAANTWCSGHADYSPAARRAFQKWLREKYDDSNDALRRAWNSDDPALTFETASVPSADLRDRSMEFAILDPALNPDAPAEFRQILDYNAFFQDAMTRNILALAHVIKEETHGKKLCFFFYGYSYEFASVFKGPAASAHYNMRAVLDSPDVDVICSPMSYFERQPGGGGSCMLNAESVTAAGKIYLYEDDTRTYLAEGSTAPGWESGSGTPEGTRNLLLRNTAESAVRNFGIWWMDLGGAGWFDSPELWKIMDELRGMDEYFLKNPTPYTPEAGLILDEKSMWNIGSGRFSAKSVSHIRLSMNRLGAPYAQYLLDDLISGRAAPPKLCVVVNSPCLTAETKALLEQKTAEQETKTGIHSTILWVDFDGMEPEKLRETAKNAGIHFYTEEPCSVWANGPYIVLHAPQDGLYHVHPRDSESELSDVITGEKIVAEIFMKKGETRVLQAVSRSEK